MLSSLSSKFSESSNRESRLKIVEIISLSSEESSFEVTSLAFNVPTIEIVIIDQGFKRKTKPSR